MQGYRVQGYGWLKVWVYGGSTSLERRVWDVGFKAIRFRLTRFGVQGLGLTFRRFRVEGLGFRR